MYGPFGHCALKLDLSTLFTYSVFSLYVTLCAFAMYDSCLCYIFVRYKVVVQKVAHVLDYNEINFETYLLLK